MGGAWAHGGLINLSWEGTRRFRGSRGGGGPSCRPFSCGATQIHMGHLAGSSIISVPALPLPSALLLLMLQWLLCLLLLWQLLLRLLLWLLLCLMLLRRQLLLWLWWQLLRL